MLSDNYIVPEITWLFLRIFKGTLFSKPVVHSLKWTTGSARNLEKGIKKAKTQLASGPLFKVDHWLGQKPRKSPKKAKTQLASGPLFKVDH